MEILRALEENATTIPDPNAYVLAACAEGGNSAPIHEKREDVVPEEKLRRRITWMNGNLPLEVQLSYDRLAPELLALEPKQAMEVLKRLEENVSTVRDPHAWISGAVRRLDQAGGGGGRAEPHGNAYAQSRPGSGGDGE